MIDFSSPPKSGEANQIALKRKLMEDRLLKKTVHPKGSKKEYSKEELANRKKEFMKVSRSNIQQILNQSKRSSEE